MCTHILIFRKSLCIRIVSFLSDGTIVELGVVLLNTSLNAMYLNIKEFDFTMFITMAMPQEI
jgi:hypothetical protein